MSSRYNIILAGTYGVGKSSIFRRLQHPDSIEDSNDDGRGLDRFTHKTSKDGRDIEVSM